MKTRRSILFIMLIMVICAGLSYAEVEKLTEEQMTAYRTRPAVVLIYSGMFVNITLGNGQQFNVPHYGSGSGFFINPDGYLVTNGHVVNSYQKYMEDKAGYAKKVFDNFIMNKIVTEFKQTRGRQPNDQEINSEYMKFMKNQQPRIFNHGAINYVLLSNSETHRFEVKKFSPSIPEGGKDIAVLKIERENCPVIMLGDSSKLALQEPVFTIGFPAVVDPQRFPLLGKENTLRSSITRGAISALKTDYKGMSVIQHDSATSPGNSGGPTVDSKGYVIGVHSYATRDYDGFKFCVPINSAKEFIRDAGVEYNKSSDFTVVFNKLMDAVWESRWFEAREHVNAALAYMENEPDLKKLNQLIIKNIGEMDFFQKIWNQNQAVVVIVVVLLILIVVVLIVAFKPGSGAQAKASAPAGSAAVPTPPAAEKTKVADEPGTILEGDISGSLTVIVKGEEVGVFNITATPMIVGRDPSTASVVVNNELVSKNHLKIIPKGDQFYLIDLGSTNGTYVNGEKISEAPVKLDDEVQLGKRGDIKLVFKK